MSLFHKNDLYSLPKEIIIEKILPEIERVWIKKFQELEEENHHHKIQSLFAKEFVDKYECSHKGCDNYAYSDIGDSNHEWWCFKKDPYKIKKKSCVVQLNGLDEPVIGNDSIQKHMSKYGVFCLQCWKWTCGDHFNDNVLIENDNEIFCKSKECQEEQ